MGAASELQVITIDLHYLSIVIFAKRIIAECLTFETTLHIERRVIVSKSCLKFYVIVALFKVIRQFLELTLNTAAVLLQRIIKQCGVCLGILPLRVIGNDVHEIIFIMKGEGSRGRASIYRGTLLTGSFCRMDQKSYKAT